MVKVKINHFRLYVYLIFGLYFCFAMLKTHNLDQTHICRNMFPENIIQATFQQVQTVYVKQFPKLVKNDSVAMEAIKNGSQFKLIADLEYKDGMNVLGMPRTLKRNAKALTLPVVPGGRFYKIQNSDFRFRF